MDTVQIKGAVCLELRLLLLPLTFEMTMSNSSFMQEKDDSDGTVPSRLKTVG